MNKKQSLGTGVLFLIVAMLIASCSPQTEASASGDLAHDDNTGGHIDDDHMEDDQHEDGMEHTHVEPPEEFAGLINPLGNDREAIEAGEATYGNLCVSCHGDKGNGDGPAAGSLTPPPARLSDGEMIGMVGDDYLFWRISKGGTIDPFNSAMIAWEDALTEEQRWQVVSYIRTLSGESGMVDDNHD